MNVGDWTNEEIEYLKENYSDTSNINLSNYLNKSVNKIKYLSSKLKLFKSKEYISEMMNLRNKKMGRDLNIDNLTNIAKKYKTRGQFIKEDPSAYSAARKLNILDEICSHMISQSYSVPQLILKNILEKIFNEKSLYNTKKIISPYELDIYFDKWKLAFEYNGKKWHINNNNDKIKKKICEEKNIKLFYIVENNRNYEKDIKTQLIYILPKLNKITSMNLTPNNINEVNVDNSIYDRIIDEKDIKNIVNKYTFYKDFRENEKSLYSKLVKLKLIDKYTSQLYRERELNWDINKIKKEVSKYEYLMDFIENSHSCYIFINKNKKYKPLLKKLKYRYKTFQSKEELWEIVKSHKSYYSLYKNDQKYIIKLKKIGEFDKVKKFYDNLYSEEDIWKVVKSYKNYNDFRKSDAYHQSNKLLLKEIKEFYLS